jgi:hypothetical protein
MRLSVEISVFEICRSFRGSRGVVSVAFTTELPKCDVGEHPPETLY